MGKLVTIYGGSGFVGRYIARRLAKEGWRIRVAVRRPNEALFVRPYGTVGQVEPVFCNIRSDASVRAAMKGADAVVNCVGVLAETGANRFDAVQHEGAGRIARIAAEEGVGRMVHLSSIGANAEADSRYAATKGLGEAAVLKHMPKAAILRPSIIFGPEDRFFNRFAAMARLGPVLPLIGADTRFQPVYVADVAEAAALAAMGKAKPGIYELGGPEIKTFRELMADMLKVIHRRRLILGLPFWAGSAMGAAFDALQAVTVGLFRNGILTRDQVKNLRHDNVANTAKMGFAALDIAPTAMEAVLPDYLWRFRPSGQYDAIKASAKNLKA
jgi:NADH dehydrogenase